MSIHPLPDGAVRQLGATLAINTPVLLVKELLDNSFDSGATTISIFISPDVVGRIEVRDNGRGIHPVDFSSLGRSGYTSKLRSLNKLPQIGGSSLGFRGVALSSITALAEVTVTTRTSRETVATIIRLVDGCGGAVEGCRATPVGTNICVKNLFAKHPVRLRRVMEDAPSAIAKIKQLLHSYVLARHHTRIEFRVLGKPDSIWFYTPKPGSSVKEAAIQLFGPAVASQNALVRSHHNNWGNTRRSLGVSEPVFSFEGLLPRPTVHQELRRGVFFSVDLRPISHSRGIGKKLLTRTRIYIDRWLSPVRSTGNNPFILMNISCPPGSYDINIEPAKDDLLFVDENQLMDEYTGFLSSIYNSQEAGDYDDSECGAQAHMPPTDPGTQDDDHPSQVGPDGQAPRNLR